MARHRVSNSYCVAFAMTVLSFMSIVDSHRPAAGSATLLSRVSPGLKLPPAYTYYFVAATPSNGIKKTDVTRRLFFDYIHCILCPLLYYIGVAGSSPLNYSFIGKRSQNAQTVKKVPSSRHGARPQGQVHGSALNFVPRNCEAEARPADETAEAQRKRGAACGRN